MTEIVLDVPNAYHILSKFVERCLNAGFLSSSIAEQVPQRSVDGSRVREFGCIKNPSPYECYTCAAL